MCKNSHPLKEDNLVAMRIGNVILGMSCDCCKENFVGKYYTCNQCKYSICPECYTFLTYPAAGHPVLRCAGSHLLRWAPTAEFVCDYCTKKICQERFRCKECNFDVCSECSEILVSLMMKPEKKTHGNTNHSLRWNPHLTVKTGGNPVQCRSCLLRFSKVGMYSCDQCDNFYCALCYHNPNRPKPQLVQPQGINQNLLTMQLLASLLRPN